MEIEEFLRRFGDNLRQARWAMGLTQEQVAAQGITYRYYQELERGQRNPTIETLHLLGEILNVPVAYLVDVNPSETLKTHKRLDAMELKGPKRGRKPKAKTRKAGKVSSSKIK